MKSLKKIVQGGDGNQGVFEIYPFVSDNVALIFFYLRPRLAFI